ELAASLVQPAVAGRTDPGVGLRQETELRVARPHLLEDGDRLGIVGAVVDDEYLQPWPGLGGERGERLGQIRCEIGIRDDNAYQRRFLRRQRGFALAE